MRENHFFLPKSAIALTLGSRLLPAPKATHQHQSDRYFETGGGTGAAGMFGPVAKMYVAKPVLSFRKFFIKELGCYFWAIPLRHYFCKCFSFVPGFII